jgi:hypothetical protein
MPGATEPTGVRDASVGGAATAMAGDTPSESDAIRVSVVIFMARVRRAE